jgi:IS5 family transposase
MFRTVGDEPSLRESLLPAEVLRLPGELARVDALLDDPAFFAPFAPCFHPVLGWPSTPVEFYLRLMFLKFRYRLGYESLCAEVSDSISWRRFCRIPLDGTVPHPATLMKLTSRCGSAAVAGLNEALLARAAGDKLLRTARLRADTTVLPANVSYPTDSGLLARAVRRIAATGRRIQAAGGATRTRVRDRGQAAGKRAHAIAVKLSSRAAQAREEKQAAVARSTGELADLAECAVAGARRLLANARRALRRAGTKAAALAAAGLKDAAAGRRRGRLHRAVSDLAGLLDVTVQVAAQARQRLAGTMPPGATRRVSLHDGDARPIARGRLGKPVEFGYKAQVTGNDDGVVLDYAVGQGNPADGPQLAPAIGRVIKRPGKAPDRDRRPQLRREIRRRRPAHSGSATWPSRARANPARPARPPGTGRRSGGPSSGEPAAKAASAHSNGNTAGTAPAWTAPKEPGPGRQRSRHDMAARPTDPGVATNSARLGRAGAKASHGK